MRQILVSLVFEGVQYLVDLLNLKEIGIFLLEDLASSWKIVLVGLVVSSLFSVS